MKIDSIEAHLLFGDHFNNPNNERILFSAKYGAGKSYFLNEFFNNRLECNTFFISPINYAVSQNEDIFEYIKFDIAKEILFKYSLPSNKITVENNLFWQSYVLKRPKEIFKLLLDPIIEQEEEDFGLPLKSLKAIVYSLISDFKKYKQELEDKDKNDNELLKEFIELSLNNKGSIYEEDLITLTIKAYLQNITDEGKKKNVLIIDDLDRLDPEHIFRILNILSAHNNHNLNDNKFGFDKIILVCDYDNIREIYEHKYGSKTDFKGYIEKFYSNHVYRYSFTTSVSNFCKNNLEIESFDQKSLEVLKLILNYLLNNGIINVRRLKKYEQLVNDSHFILENNVSINHIKNSRNSFVDCDSVCIDVSEIPFLRVFKILINIFGDYNELKSVVEKISIEGKGEFNIDSLQNIVESICVLSHVAKSGNDRKLCAAQFDESNYGHPKALFLGKLVNIQLQWSKTNKYAGQNYFEKAEFNFDKSENSKKQMSNYKALFGELKNILDYLENNGKLKELSISANY